MNKSSIKKIIAFFCVLALMLTVAGCGTRVEETSVWIEGEGKTETITHSSGTSGVDGTTGDSGNSSTGKFENTDVGGVQSSTGDKKMDLGGRTVTIAMWGGGDGKPSPSSPTYKEETKVISDIEKKYNCKIEFKMIADSMGYQSAWVAAAQAGTKFADIAQFSTGWVYHSHMKMGYLTKLDNYINVNEAIFNQSAKKQMEYNGGTYAVVMSNRWYTPAMLYYNRSIFDKLGVETPDKYVARNEWTLDNFLKVAKDLTKQSGGTQYYGFDNVTGTTVGAFIEIMGGKQIVTENGKKVYNPDKKCIDAVQWASDLKWTHNVVGGKYEEGTAAMAFMSPFNGSEYMEALGASNVGATWLPKANASAKHTAQVVETTCLGIPSTAKNPEVLAQILRDYYYPYKWRKTLEENCENVAGDSTSIKTAMEVTRAANNNMQLSPLYTYISRTIGWGDYGINSKTSPQAFFATHKSAAQAELDSFWGQ